jgi:uncharacterized membrane protein YphA (DoxX/SURF4 family)
VHIVAVLQYISGIVMLLAAVAIVFVTYGSGEIRGNALPPSVRTVASAGLAIAALTTVGGLLALMIGRRLQRGKQWARVLMIALSAVSLGANIYALIRTGVADPLSGLVLPILYLLLLNTPPARAFFRHPWR